MRLSDPYVAELRAEVLELCRRERPSDVRAAEHVTHWTRPRGEVLQFSLLNASGCAADFSVDHDLSSFGKRFHHSADHPHLASLIDALPDLLNFRVNVLGPRARLAAHEEHSIVRTHDGSLGACIRFHLPLVTSPGAELMLDGHVFHLEAGVIHFVNHGCVHAVRNGGAIQRVHLVWDALLTRSTYDAAFGDGPGPVWASRFKDHERTPAPLRVERMGAYVRLPSSITREAAEGLDLCHPQ
jgi:hypothetical protein